MSHTFLRPLTLLILLLSSGALAADSATKTKLALNWKPEPEFGGFYQAHQDGTNKKHGLEVEILPGGAGQPVAQMIAAGTVEFGIISGDELLIARSRGADLVAIFAVYQTNPFGIMVHASKKITHLSEVFSSGLTLAIEKGKPVVTFLEKKYPFSKVKIVPYTGGVGAFLHDPNFAQQCFVTAEPVTAKREGADPQSFLISESGYNPYTAVVVVRGQTLREKRALVERMHKAMKEGWKNYLAHPEATNEAMQKLNTTMTVADFNEAARIQHPLIETKETRTKGLGFMSAERWKQLTEQLLELKVIEKAPDVAGNFVKL